MPRLRGGVSELKEVVGELGRTGHLAGSLETEDEKILRGREGREGQVGEERRRT